jgi:hypothetical protein
MLTARLDYVQGVCYFDDLSDLEAFLSSIASFLNPADEWSFRNYGLYTGEKFSKCFSSAASGFRGAYRQLRDGSFKAILFLPGTFMAACQGQSDLISFLSASGFRYTRLDIAVDDYLRRVSPGAVKQVGDLGDYTLVDSFKYISSGSHSSLQVGTCYFGVSDKVLRFYDAEVMHGIPADRWELQLRRHYANEVVEQFLDNPNCLASLVFHSIDIIDRSRSTWRRVYRYSWWQSLREEAGYSVFPASSPYEFDISRSIEWLYKQVAPTLAVCRHGLGEQGFTSLMDDVVASGSDRFQAHHYASIKYLQKGVA